MSLKRKKLMLFSGSKSWQGYLRTVSGNPVTITDALKQKKIDVIGSSYQSSTPSPDLPIEIQAVGDFVSDNKYKIPISVKGKNMINLSTMKPIYSNKNAIKVIENKVYFLYNETYDTRIFSFDVDVKKGEAYSISFKDDVVSGTGNLKTYIKSSDGKEQYLDQRKMFTANIDANKFLIYVDAGVFSERYIYDIQFEKNSVATVYEPFLSASFDVFTTQQLHGTETNGDTVTIDFDKKKAVLTQNVKTAFCKGTEGFENINKGFYNYDGILSEKIYPTDFVKCTHYINGTDWIDTNGEAITLGGSTGKAYLYFRGSRFYNSELPDKGVSSLKTFLKDEYDKGNPVTIYYLSPNPIVTDISTLQDWTQFKNLKGTVTVTTTLNINPNLEIQYYSLEKE